jgi:hypothetical protein
MTPRDILSKIFGSNPLIDALPQRIRLSDLPQRLAFNPLAAIGDWKEVPLDEREGLLGLAESFFTASPTLIDFTTRLQDMVVDGYMGRNPTNPEHRARLYEKLALLREGKPIETSPNAMVMSAGILLNGITGTSKSTTHKRATQVLFPRQVIPHGPNEAAGWIQHKQLVYLELSLQSAEGSLPLWVDNAYRLIDSLLGTEYAKRSAGRRETIPQRVGGVLAVLLAHNLGFLVLEELQLRSLGRDDQAAMFMLQVMNAGIPIVLVSNPLGWDRIARYSQDASRLTSRGRYELLPAESKDDRTARPMARSYWNFNVMDQLPDIDEPFLDSFYEKTAFIPRPMRIMVQESQRAALRRGDPRVTAEHLNIAWRSSNMSEHRKQIEGFVTKNAELLGDKKDVPVEWFRRRWKAAADAAAKAKAAAEAAAKERQQTPPDPANPLSPGTPNPEDRPFDRASDVAGDGDSGTGAADGSVGNEGVTGAELPQDSASTTRLAKDALTPGQRAYRAKREKKAKKEAKDKEVLDGLDPESMRGEQTSSHLVRDFDDFLDEEAESKAKKGKKSRSGGDSTDD